LLDGSSKRKRNFSYQLLEANRLSNLLFSAEVLEDERRLAEWYAQEKKDLVVILADKDDHTKYLAIHYMQRFSPNYANKIWRKLFKEIGPKLSCYNAFLHGTFTVNWTKYSSQAEIKKAVQDGWNKLMTIVRREIRGVNGERVEYIKTIEWQENGMGCHLHVLFCGIGYIDVDWLRPRWIEENPRGVHLRYVGDNWKKAVNYLFKYILKSSLNNEGGKLNLSAIINWATFTRSFSVSRGLSLGTRKTNSNGNWVFVGVILLETYNKMSRDQVLEYIDGSIG